MDKRTIWAFILIIAVFWISSEFIWKTNKVKEPSKEQIKETFGNEGVPLQNQSDEKAEKTSPEPEILEMESIDNFAEDIELNDTIVLENDKIRVSFTNQGARINSIVLKDYFLADKVTPVDLIRDQSNLFGIEYVDITGNQHKGTPVMYEWEKPNPESVIFSGQGSFGSEKKTFILRDNYQLDMFLSVSTNQEQFDYILKLDCGIADTERYLKRKNQNYQVVLEIDNKVERLTLQKLKKNKELTGKIDWIALRSKFFAIGIVKDELSTLHRIFAYANNGSPAFRLFGRSPKPVLDAQFSLYLGPVVSEEMEKLGEGFGSAYYAGNGIFFGQGFIKPVSRLFEGVFKQFHHVIPNWGLCLILFSVLIKLLLYPLTHKSYESSTKLQKIQPQITELREKYKKDPQKMNQEMQRIYRENGVSPLGGCLPMLLQMPIFFALYPVIRYSIDLRQAGFLWLKDLSEPDPYWILPILMAVFMFLQQYLMQPKKEALAEMSEQQRAQMQNQRMMMYIMPAIMFFLFKSFPSGLVLYWTVFNIMSMFQQRMIKRKFS